MKNYFFIAIAALMVASCGTKQVVTLSEKYPKMYEERPLSIVIMPPINQTNHAEAKDYFYTTLHAPLCERGYYVFSPMMVMEMFQTESAYDAERFIEGDLSQFRNVLGADAAMFTTIKSWKRNNLGGNISVEIEYLLRSTKTGETLYKRGGKITVDTSVGNSSGSLIGMVISKVATAINTAATDKVVAGRQCSFYVLGNMPQGKYGAMYDKDQQAPAGEDFIIQTVK